MIKKHRSDTKRDLSLKCKEEKKKTQTSKQATAATEERETMSTTEQ